jgi:hypothetical protein
VRAAVRVRVIVAVIMRMSVCHTAKVMRPAARRSPFSGTCGVTLA